MLAKRVAKIIVTPINFLLFFSLIIYLIPQINTFGATPVVDTQIYLEKTGSEPFNTNPANGGLGDCTDNTVGTWHSVEDTFPDGELINDGSFGAPGDNAGKDNCEDNDVVRLGDSITYRVETSVNDSDVENLIAEVVVGDGLDTKQEWIQIPSGCSTNSAEVNPISALIDSNGDGGLDTLICNMGSAIEGTSKVIFPAAKVTAATSASATPVLNDEITSANVSAYGVSDTEGTSDTDTDGPVYINITADFRVEIEKTLDGKGFDGDGNPIYPKRVEAQGPAGEDGVLMKWLVQATYRSGSMVADDNNGDGTSDYSFIDIFTDDSLTNDGALSTGAILYQTDWSDPATTDCGLIGDHGASATLTCTPGTPIDFTGGSYAADGVDDYSVVMNYDSIDPTDPDNDSNLINSYITLWVPQTDLCGGSGNCTVFNINSVYDYDENTGLPSEFIIESTEYNLAGDKLLNYDGSGEPGGGVPDNTNNNDTYQVNFSNPGYFSTRKSFYGSTSTISVNPKTGEKPVAPGEITNFGNIIVFNNNAPDNRTGQICDKIDHNNLEFIGLSEPNYRYPFNYSESSTSITPNNPTIRIGSNNSPILYEYYDGTLYDDIYEILYSSEPHTTLAEQRDDGCDDDVNNDGVINILDENGVESNPGNPVDWYKDANMLPNGPSDVAKVRTELNFTQSFVDSLITTGAPFRNYFVFFSFDVRVKDNAIGYGSREYITNYTTGREFETGGPEVDWLDETNHSIDPESVAFSLDTFHHDRLRIARSGISLSKYTNPAGIKVVLAGDIIEFYLEPQVFGRWSGAQTANLNDNLPAQTDYIGGSEMFSVDGGATWVDLATYNANFAAGVPGYDVSINSPTSTHGPDADPLIWTFGSVEFDAVNDVADKLPLIKYSVLMDPSVNSGNFTNTAILSSPFIAARGARNLTSVTADDVGVAGVINMPFAGYDYTQVGVTLYEQVAGANGSTALNSICRALDEATFIGTTNVDATGNYSFSNVDYPSLADGTDYCLVYFLPETKRAAYTLKVVPEYGFEVLKQNAREVYSTNEEFTFDLTYKNLGEEAFSGGEFIDILPFNGDAAVGIGGVNSARTPSSDFSGYYSLTEIDTNNNENVFVTDVDPSTLNLDPCASSNVPNGYIPSDPAVSGLFIDELCYRPYINNGNLLPDGQPAGTFSANWQLCGGGATKNVVNDCPIDPLDVTAIKFDAPNVSTTGGQTVSITMYPVGNIGGEPVFTADENGTNIVDWANSPDIGDIYTNSFGGRIPEISLNVISNDVSVTPVWGSVGDLVWFDYNNDGNVQLSDDPIAGIELEILDSNGNPVWIDPVTGIVINNEDRADYEANTGVTLEPYTATTDANGQYLFENLSSGDYTVQLVSPEPGIPSYDFDDGLGATDNSTSFTLGEEFDLQGNLTGIQDRDDIDFGYRLREFDVELAKELLTTGPFIVGQTVDFRITVENQGPDYAPGVEVSDTPSGLTFVTGSEVASTGAYTDPVWSIGRMDPGALETLDLSYTITETDLTNPIYNFAEVTSDGEIDGRDIDSEPGDNISGDEADPSESDSDLVSGTDTHDDEDGVPLNVVANPAIDLIKTAGDAADGEIYINDPEGTVTFTYEVVNTGGTNLSDMVIVDDAGTPLDASDDITLTSAECADLTGPLAPGERINCTADLLITALITPYTNTALVKGLPTNDNGDPIPGATVPTDDDPAEVIVPPAIKITKLAGRTEDGEELAINELGEVTFNYFVENTGGTYLTEMVIVDDAGTPSDTDDDITITRAECPDLRGPLAPGDRVRCSISLRVDQYDYVNVAQVTGSPTDEDGNVIEDNDGDPLFEDPTDRDDAEVGIPNIDIIKVVKDEEDGSLFVNQPEGSVTFEYQVENTGGTYLIDMEIVDDAGTPTDTADDVTIISAECPVLSGPLAPGAIITCESDFEITTENSPYQNNATVVGTPADENSDPYRLERPTDEDPARVVVPPAIEVIKTAGTAADGDGYAINEFGDVEFTYTVTNIGGTYLTNIELVDNVGTVDDVSDDIVFSDTICPGLAGPLAPGDSVVCTRTLPVDSVSYINTVMAIGSPTDENGNVYENGNGDPLFEEPTDDDDAEVLIPDIEIIKTVQGEADDSLFINDPAGPVIFEFEVINSGGTHLSDIVISDDAGTPTDTTDDVTMTSVDCPALTGPLAPTDAITCTLTLDVDPSNSPYTNNAGITSNPTDENGDEYPDVDDPTDEDDAEVIVPPAIEIVKTAGGAGDGDILNLDSAGDVEFTYTVTNTGGTYLTDILITDDNGTPADTSDDATITSAECPDLAGPLAPGDSVTCTQMITVSNPTYTNTAGVTGAPTDSNGDVYEDENGDSLFENLTDSDDAEVAYPDLEIIKTAGQADNGDAYVITESGSVTFTFDVTNTGGTHLTNLTITDDNGTPADSSDDVVITATECPALAGPVAPQDTVTCTLDLEVTDTDYVNNASVFGTPTDSIGTPVTDPTGNPIPGPVDEDEAEVFISQVEISIVDPFACNDGKGSIFGSVDYSGDINNVSVVIEMTGTDGTVYTLNPTLNIDGTYTIEFDDSIPEGEYDIIATATDIFGNTAEFNYQATIFFECEGSLSGLLNTIRTGGDFVNQHNLQLSLLIFGTISIVGYIIESRLVIKEQE